MQAFVPKNRRPKFELALKIIDLNNVPLTHGTSYVKWHLPASTSAEHRGRTNKVSIKEHRATYTYSKHLPVRLTVDRNSMLQDSEVDLEVVQEYDAGMRGGERIVLGIVKLNLAEYASADESQNADGIIERRYLMQDSKVNSTLKVGIGMKLVEGERNFVTPPLKTAMVFGGIAGIMSGEAGDAEDIGHLPSLNLKTREMSELQDMYRRTLAASWAMPTGDLSPHQVVEDIFAGGNGGLASPGKSTIYDTYRKAQRPRQVQQEYDDNSWSDTESSSKTIGGGSGILNRSSPSLTHSQKFARTRTSQRDSSTSSGGTRGHVRNRSRNSMDGDTGDSVFKTNFKNSSRESVGGSASGGMGSVSGRGSIEDHLGQTNDDLKKRGMRSAQRTDIAEMDLRDDLKSWKISWC